MSHPVLRTLGLAGALFTIGCASGEPPTAPGPAATSVAGAWSLESVNGQSLPFPIPDPTVKTELLQDVYVLQGEGTFRETFIARFTRSTGVVVDTLTADGRYSLAGSVINIRYDDGTAGMADLNGDALMISARGYALVYRRQ